MDKNKQAFQPNNSKSVDGQVFKGNNKTTAPALNKKAIIGDSHEK